MKYVVSLCDVMTDACYEVVFLDSPEDISNYIKEKCTDGYTVSVRLNEKIV